VDRPSATLVTFIAARERYTGLQERRPKRPAHRLIELHVTQTTSAASRVSSGRSAWPRHVF